MPQEYVRNRDNIVASYTDCLVYSSDDVQQLSPSAAHHETNIKKRPWLSFDNQGRYYRGSTLCYSTEAEHLLLYRPLSMN